MRLIYEKTNIICKAADNHNIIIGVLGNARYAVILSMLLGKVSTPVDEKEYFVSLPEWQRLAVINRTEYSG